MSLDLSLPEPERKRGGGVLPVLMWLSVLVLLGVLLVRTPAAIVGGGSDRRPLFGADLAETLEKRTLYGQAAAIWEEIAPGEDDPATALFRAGRCRMLAGEPARAIRNFLAAEEAGLPDDLAAESSRRVLECYAVLGKFAVRDAELRARTGGEPAEGSDVVARVGEEVITREELHLAVRDEEAVMLAQTGKLDEKTLDEAVAARMADEAGLARTLMGLVSRRILAIEALARGIADEPEFSRRMAEIRREVLASMLVRERLMKGVTLSDGDLRDHWSAHRDRYTDPEAARFAWGPPDAAPDDLVEAGGWHAKGAAFPDGLGRSAEADAALFALSPGEVTRPLTIGGREVRLRLVEFRPAREVPFEEARDRVAEDLARRRRLEAVQALRSEIEARHPVKILDDKLARAVEEAAPR